MYIYMYIVYSEIFKYLQLQKRIVARDTVWIC